MEMYPLRFHEILKERIWGGRGLKRLFRKPLKAGRLVGESWEICDRPPDVSVVMNGPLAGKSLAELVRCAPGELLGADFAGGPRRFPLLQKLLDARDVLSVQVHPPAGVAERFRGDEPKMEAWVVLRARPGARVFAGLKRGTRVRSLAAAITAGRVEELLVTKRVKAGDVIPITPGTVHALGAGVVVLEVSENSDTTYRLCDWGRVGDDGRPRPLHVAKGLLAVSTGRPATGSKKKHPLPGRVVVDAPELAMSVLSVRGTSLLNDAGRFRTVFVVEGRGVITWSGCRDGEPVRAGESLLLPAALKDVTIRAQGGRGAPCSLVFATCAAR
jgi:mannose-6-phosphate isomerase